MKNIMTIDLEEWFHFNTSDVEISKDVYSKVRVVDATKVILDLFEQYKVKATFFCLEYVASKYPDLIKLISEKGHEIASHGINHKLVYEQTPEEFEQEIKKSVDILEQITGKKVLGFRAPSWSITKKSLWALQVLQDLGLKYDASVFPIKTFLFGIPDAPRKPYYPEYNGKKLEILEIPCQLWKFLAKDYLFREDFILEFYLIFLLNGEFVIQIIKVDKFYFTFIRKR